MEKLISEFKVVCESKGKYNLVSQVPYLSRLAEHYEATAALNGNDWVCLLKVSTKSIQDAAPQWETIRNEL